MICKMNIGIQGAETGFGGRVGVQAGWGMAKIELPEDWGGVVEPLRALMAEVEREAHAGSTTPPDLAAMSARWARVSDAIYATVRARIADAQAESSQAPKR